MQGPTIEELRDLSRYSRRAQAWGAFAMLCALALVPAVMVLPTWWAAYGAVLAGGLLFLRYAYLAGEERGAFRKVFRRIKDEKKLTRTLVPESPEAAVRVVERV